MSSFKNNQLPEGLVKNADGRLEGQFSINAQELGGRFDVSMVEGQLSGPVKTYDAEGRITAAVNFKNGKLSGPAEIYVQGTIKIKAEYENGKFHGLVSSYFPNGNIATQTFYKNGLKNGEHRAYTIEGQLVTIEHYENGIRQGKSYFLDKEGEVVIESNYQQDQRDGEYIQYYPSGTVQQITVYKDGQVVEPTIRYDIRGHILEDI